MIDISEVNVGDRVRITRENGDEATFTVTNNGKEYLNSGRNIFYVEDWLTLEIVERAFKPVPGLYTSNNSYEQYLITPTKEVLYFSGTGAWVKTITPDSKLAKVVKYWTREITF